MTSAHVPAAPTHLLPQVDPSLVAELETAQEAAELARSEAAALRKKVASLEAELVGRDKQVRV